MTKTTTVTVTKEPVIRQIDDLTNEILAKIKSGNYEEALSLSNNNLQELISVLILLRVKQDEKKLFACIWGSWDETAQNDYAPNTDINLLTFFGDNNGYQPEDISAISNLELGKEYNVTYGNHKVIRIS